MNERGSLLENIPHRAGLERLWDIFPEARLVGGSVRDLLRGVCVSDLDLATPEPPEIVCACLERASIRVIPTGLSHGTVTAVIDHVSYEITTLRRDLETDGRHAVVVWTRDWEEDAARRDFTINAMSLDRQGILYDYFHGVEDLRASRVRFVGDAGRRIEEDALRALRFFRFDARYGSGTPDRDACAAIAGHLSLIECLSAERIASELLRILGGPRLAGTLEAMEGVGLLPLLLPSSRRDRLQRLLDCDSPVMPLLRLFALASDHAEEVGKRLKMSNADIAALIAFGTSEPVLALDLSDDDLRRARAVQKLDVLIARSWLVQASTIGKPDAAWDSLRTRMASLPQPVFPLGGKDAIGCGVEKGRAVGLWLQMGRDWWMSQGCRPDMQECLRYLCGLDEASFHSSETPC